MVFDCDLISEYNFMTDFNGINRQFPNPVYPSGIYDGEKAQYRFGNPSNEYPNITLPVNLYDRYGNKIPAGFYNVIISKDRKFLNLYQSNELKARIKILKLVEEMRTSDEKDEEAEILAKIEKAKSKKKLKKLKKAQEELEAFKETQAAKHYAVLEELDAGYYKIKYSCFGQKAEGIIQK